MRKVHDGTPIFGGKSLCESCDNCILLKGESDSAKRVYCQILPYQNSRIRMKVTSCTGYEEKNTATLGEMHKMAWHIDVDRKTREFGFSSPKDREKDKAGL